VIYGSFYDVNAPRLRWLPRSWRAGVSILVDAAEKQLSKRRLPPVTLFHTGENLRHDHIKADFAITHDLNVLSEDHHRLPYWMEVIDWMHEGVIGNSNSRYGGLLKLERLMKPLGNQFSRRAQKAVLITSHMREPRASGLEAIKKIMPVDGMGPYFDKAIKDHHQSNFLKKDVLEKYAFNFCPENSIYPGYVTEKIPEAFASGCIPITIVDFSAYDELNSNGFINLMEYESPFSIQNIANIKSKIIEIADYPLMSNRPSLCTVKVFIKKIIESL
jgi:hypothetical protein